MDVLVVGGYGLIGSAICRNLLAAGHRVTGLGRSAGLGARLVPGIDWIEGDLSRMANPDDWASALKTADAVVNASGILQSGSQGSAHRVQTLAVQALIEACEHQGVSRFVQISAPGATTGHRTEFYSTKAEADDRLKASRLDWVIFRPGLVISPNAYGGTSLIRMLAAFPVVQPVSHGRTQIQTVSVDDVAGAVAIALANPAISGDFDLVEDHAHSLQEVVLDVRAWLGFRRPVSVIQMPPAITGLLGRVADLAGWLGWRPALRTTALRVLTDPIEGSAQAWTRASGQRLKPLAATLAAMPATLQERIAARAMLAFPILLLTLSLFWIASGVIGYWQFDTAAARLENRLSPRLAEMAVLAGSLADILIGVGLLIRRWVRPACLASILLSLAYLVGASFLVPALWTDPLGPLMKILPVMACSLAVVALAERR